MGVMMQAFYWDCPAREGREGAWWGRVERELPALRAAGITALWLPPACKGMNATGMGYDPYDYYDLGEFDQKGAVETWFGSRAALESLIGAAHSLQMQVYADLVLNHCSGADAEELNPISGEMGWTRFQPASRRFPRNWNSFHPSEYESWDDQSFGAFPDLCHRNPQVFLEVMAYVKWLVEEIGYDGFRYDFVKGFGYAGHGAWLITAIQEYRYRRQGAQYYKPFGVLEYWEEEDVSAIERYLDGANYWSDNEVTAFDFPLRRQLARLCDERASLRELAQAATLVAAQAAHTVTFVENHDISRERPIVHDKMLAYAYILTHEGYPCIFWEDYYNYGLGRPGHPAGIEALALAHERYATGATDLLYADDTLYLMQRRGVADQDGLVFALNAAGDAWRGATVQTAFANARLRPIAFGSDLDAGIPMEKLSDDGGRADFWAPPRGYAVYARA
jgi:alpha-amylase